MWGAKAPTPLEGFPAARGRPDLQNRRFPVGQKIIYSKPRCSVLTPPSGSGEMALEVVSGADFSCKLMCGAGPVDLRGSRGPRGRPDPENDRFSAKSKTPPLLNPPSGNRRTRACRFLLATCTLRLLGRGASTPESLPSLSIPVALRPEPEGGV